MHFLISLYISCFQLFFHHGQILSLIFYQSRLRLGAFGMNHFIPGLYLHLDRFQVHWLGYSVYRFIWFLNNSLRNYNVADEAYSDDSQEKPICCSIFACLHIISPVGLLSRRNCKTTGEQFKWDNANIREWLTIISQRWKVSCSFLWNGTNVFGMIKKTNEKK